MDMDSLKIFLRQRSRRVDAYSSSVPVRRMFKSNVLPDVFCAMVRGRLAEMTALNQAQKRGRDDEIIAPQVLGELESWEN
jgi:hypothetical protein